MTESTESPGVLRKIFAKAAYLPALALVASGPLISYDYAATGRLDLLTGGILLTALGAMIVDNMTGKDFISNGLSRLFGRKANPIDPGTMMAITGLAACGVLGLGETAVFVQKHQLELRSVLDPQTRSAVLHDPAFMKIMANALPFAVASALDFPKVYKKCADVIGDNNTRMLQSGLSLIGAAMMGIFGFRTRIFSARAFSMTSIKANYLNIVVRADSVPEKDAPQPG